MSDRGMKAAVGSTVYRRKIPFDPSVSHKVFAEFQKLRVRLFQIFSESVKKDSRRFSLMLASYARLTFRAGGPGRPGDETISSAFEMRQKNRSWPSIYAALQIGSVSDRSKLRDAVRRRQHAKRRKAIAEARSNSLNCSS